MKTVILAAIAALGLGLATANAAIDSHAANSSQQGDQYNYTRGGGG